MKRFLLAVVILLILLLAGSFLALIWVGMRKGIPTAPAPNRPHSSRQGEQQEEHARRREGRSTSHQTEESCASLGLGCASQYFAAWSWPADASCHATVRDGYPEPDRRCTPGGVVPGVTAETLRSPDWRTKCIRNCQSSSAQKRAAYEWYSLPRPENNSGETQVCELDHLVPLELGGADGMGNIWPECGPDDVTLRNRYFKQKDIVENYLAAKVRAGEIPLEQAQQGIAADWVQYLEVARAACRGTGCTGSGD